MFRKLLAFFLFAALLPACTSLIPPADMKAPVIGFANLSVKDIGLSEVRFIATVTADNQNTYAMPLSDTRLEFFLMGQSVATGTTRYSKIDLPPGRITEVPLEFTVSTSQVVGLLAKVSRSSLSQLSYQLKGDAKWGTLGLPISFVRKGDLDAIKRLSELLL